MRWFRSKRLVLVVCTANVCRSPLAAALLRRKLRDRGVGRDWRVVSAGTRVGTPGRRPDPRIQRFVDARGASLRGERARQLTASLARRAELIVVMDSQQRDEVLEMLEADLSDASPPPVHRLGEWYEGDTGADGDIVDPYFSNAAVLGAVAEQISAACSGVADHLASRE